MRQLWSGPTERIEARIRIDFCPTAHSKCNNNNNKAAGKNGSDRLIGQKSKKKKHFVLFPWSSNTFFGYTNLTRPSGVSILVCHKVNSTESTTIFCGVPHNTLFTNDATNTSNQTTSLTTLYRTTDTRTPEPSSLVVLLLFLSSGFFPSGTTALQ